MKDTRPSVSMADPNAGSCASGGVSISVLASGSKGNAVFVSDGNTALLIDAGLSGIEIERRMQHRGLKAQRLQGIIVSHEHSDHVQGVGILSRRFRLPVYLTRATQRVAEKQLGKLHAVQYFEVGRSFHVRDMRIHPFGLSHDAEDPCGFTIALNGVKLGLATDLGIATAVVKEHLKACHLLLLEANHDPQMLIQGPYPWPLKQRIQGRCGHLSNADTKRLLMEIKDDRLRHVLLGHLSEQNNVPEKALSQVGLALHDSKARLTIATQEHGSPLIKIST